MLEDDTTAGQTFELYGPKNYSMAEIAQLVDREIIKHRRHLNIPKRMMKPIAKILNQLIWWKTTSADEVEREFIDQVIDPKAKTFKDLDIEPGDLADFTFQYLVGLWFMLTTVPSLVATPEANFESPYTARLPECIVLWSPACNGAGKEGRKEVSACYWWSIDFNLFGRVWRVVTSYRGIDCTYSIFIEQSKSFGSLPIDGKILRVGTVVKRTRSIWLITWSISFNSLTLVP